MKSNLSHQGSERQHQRGRGGVSRAPAAEARAERQQRDGGRCGPPAPQGRGRAREQADVYGGHFKGMRT